MKNTAVLLLLSCLVSMPLCARDEPGLNKYGVDPGAIKDGVYRGRFTPDANYVLDGHLARDFELPPMPYRYLTAEDGYKPNLSKVPAPGVHPRVIMSPSDIEEIKRKLAMGNNADRYFRLAWNYIDDGALKALCTDDDEMGRKAAMKLVDHANYVEPIVDIMNTHPQMDPIRDNWYYYCRLTAGKVGGVLYQDAYEEGGAELVHKLAKEGVEFVSDGDSHRFAGTLRGLLDYDYAHKYLTEKERVLVRRVISKITRNRYTTGMELPGNMFINNHMSMGSDLLLLALAIEDEEGYEPRILKQYGPALNNQFTYYVSQGGHLYEKNKGFLPQRAALAVTRRGLPVLSHDHLMNMVWAKAADSNSVYTGKSTDVEDYLASPRRWFMGVGSGPWQDHFFRYAFLMKFAYPESPVVDFFYKERLKKLGFGDCDLDPGAPIPHPRIKHCSRDVMLLTATDGLRGEDGKPINYDKVGPPGELTERTSAWVDLPRGVAMSRSSWDKDALHVHYECRSDVYAAGHESPEAGDFYINSHGVCWSTRGMWYMDSYFRNMVLIDGKAGIYNPTCGKLMAVEDNAAATTFISDQTDQYNWCKQEKLFYSWHPLRTENPWEGNRWRGGKFGRDWELPFQKHMKEYHEGLAGLDWGNWHGETRGPEMYSKWNEVDHVFRTLHMTKGETPYVLIVDDVRKDDQQRQYDWMLHLEPSITLHHANCPVQRRFTQDGMPQNRTTDLILCLNDTTGRSAKTGDPMLLVRVLWRNSTFAFPRPVFERGWGPPRVKVPATAVDPEFRILLFPFRNGDKLPFTQWSDDSPSSGNGATCPSRLTVSIGETTDVYTFDKTDRGRTVFAMSRNGEQIASTPYGPAAPQLDSPYGWTPDRNRDSDVRNVVFSGKGRIKLQHPPLGCEIRYTTDQSDPTDRSDLYTGPVTVDKSCTLKAKTLARHWPYREDNSSRTLTVNLVKQSLASPLPAPRSSLLAPGLACQAYELRRTIFDGKSGIFTGKTNMLPNFDNERPLLTCRVADFAIPDVKPAVPAVEMMKGYYRYQGYLKADKDGVYGFRVDSCGPVSLNVGGRDVIDVTGVYGLSQKNRYGEVALEAGLQRLELVVCDPVFWKDGREGPYQIDVAVMAPGSDRYVTVAGSVLFTDKTDQEFQDVSAVPEGKAVTVTGTVPGLVMNCYDRLALNPTIPHNGLPLEHFDVSDDGEGPYLTKPVLHVEGSAHAGRLIEYSGYLIADFEGVYAFELDADGGNQLLIDGIEIARNRTTEGTLPGTIKLDKGMHTFSLRLAQSRPDLRVKRPGSSEFETAKIGVFARPADAKFADDGRLMCKLDGEKLTDDQLDPQVPGVKATLRKGTLVDGKTGKGMKIGGADSRLVIENLAAPEDAFSLGFWIRLDKTNDKGFFNGGHLEGRLRRFSLQANYFRGSQHATYDLRKSGAADPKKWNHVVVTFAQEVRIYVNGELKSSGVKTVPSRHARINSIQLFQNQEVTVDDVMLFNKELDADAVMGLFSRDNRY